MMAPPGQSPLGLPPYRPEGGTHALTHPAPSFDPVEVQSRLDRFNRNSFLLGVPGMALQASYVFLGRLPWLMPISYLVGTVMVIVGLTFYARSRGQSPWYGLCGLLSFIGLVVLALLPRLCLVCRGPVERGYCQRCGAPGAK